jgi:hypothetical protein
MDKFVSHCNWFGPLFTYNFFTYVYIFSNFFSSYNHQPIRLSQRVWLVCIVLVFASNKKNTHPYTFQCAMHTQRNNKNASKRYCVCNGKHKKKRRKQEEKREKWVCTRKVHKRWKINEFFLFFAVFMRRSILATFRAHFWAFFLNVWHKLCVSFFSCMIQRN